MKENLSALSLQPSCFLKGRGGAPTPGGINHRCLSLHRETNGKATGKEGAEGLKEKKARSPSLVNLFLGNPGRKDGTVRNASYIPFVWMSCSPETASERQEKGKGSSPHNNGVWNLGHKFRTISSYPPEPALQWRGFLFFNFLFIYFFLA